LPLSPLPRFIYAAERYPYFEIVLFTASIGVPDLERQEGIKDYDQMDFIILNKVIVSECTF